MARSVALTVMSNVILPSLTGRAPIATNSAGYSVHSCSMNLPADAGRALPGGRRTPFLITTGQDLAGRISQMSGTLRERRVIPALERCDRFDAMLNQLEAEGVRISGSSRFRFYGKLLRAFANSGVDVVHDLTADDAMRLGIASAEVGELLEAVDMLQRP